MAVRAVHRFARVPPTKARLVANTIRGLTAEEAGSQLQMRTDNASRVLAKVLRSAIANAENNEELDRDDLVVENVLVDQGPSYRRLKPRARGRADVIRHRTSHLTVVLERSAASSRRRGA